MHVNRYQRKTVSSQTPVFTGSLRRTLSQPLKPVQPIETESFSNRMLCDDAKPLTFEALSNDVIGVVFSFLSKCECCGVVARISRQCNDALVAASYEWSTEIYASFERTRDRHEQFANWKFKHHISEITVLGTLLNEDIVPKRVKIQDTLRSFLCTGPVMSRLRILNVIVCRPSYHRIRRCFRILSRALPNLEILRWSSERDENGAQEDVEEEKEQEEKEDDHALFTWPRKKPRFNNVTTIELVVDSCTFYQVLHLLQWFPAVYKGIVQFPFDDENCAKNTLTDVRLNKMMHVLSLAARNGLCFSGLYPQNQYQTEMFEVLMPATAQAWMDEDEAVPRGHLLWCAPWLSKEFLAGVTNATVSQQCLESLRHVQNITTPVQLVNTICTAFRSLTSVQLCDLLDNRTLLEALDEQNVLCKLQSLSLHGLSGVTSVELLERAQSLHSLTIISCRNIFPECVRHLRKLHQLTKFEWRTFITRNAMDKLYTELLNERPCLLIPSLQNFKCEQYGSNVDDNHEDDEDEEDGDEEEEEEEEIDNYYLDNEMNEQRSDGDDDFANMFQRVLVRQNSGQHPVASGRRLRFEVDNEFEGVRLSDSEDEEKEEDAGDIQSAVVQTNIVQEHNPVQTDLVDADMMAFLLEQI